MAFSTDPLERFETAVRTDLITWPQLLPFRQSMAAGRPSRHFMAAVSVSVIMHAFLTFLLWGGAANRKEVEPTAPSIGTPLTVSLVSLPTPDMASQAGPEREAVSAAPHTDPPVQRSEPSPEHALDAESKAEAEPVMTLKDQGIPNSEAPKWKPLATGASLSIDREAADSTVQEMGRMQASEAGLLVMPEGPGIPGHLRRNRHRPVDRPGCFLQHRTGGWKDVDSGF